MIGLLRASLAMAALCGIAGTAVAQDISAFISGNGIGVESSKRLNNTTISIVGPNGFHLEQYSKSGNASMSLGGVSGLPDGWYNYEITAATGETVTDLSGLDNGRGPNAPKTMSKGTSSSGSFLVSNGKIVTDTGKAEQ